MPDPSAADSFAEWVKDLTADRGRRYGVTQVILAEVCGVTPQAVTKWTKGGDIEVDPLARLALWIHEPVLKMQHLVMRGRANVTLRAHLQASTAEIAGTSFAVPEIARLLADMTEPNRGALLEMARALVKSQKKVKKK